MLKRNKLSIFLLAVVLMLTVYYVRRPKEKKPSIYETSTRYASFVEKRETLASNRNVELEKLTLSISTNEDAGEIIEQYNELNSLTEREVAIEESLRDIGFTDAFVCVFLNDHIDVSIYDFEFTKSQYVMVKNILNEEFGDYQVSIYHIMEEAE